MIIERTQFRKKTRRRRGHANILSMKTRPKGVIMVISAVPVLLLSLLLLQSSQARSSLFGISRRRQHRTGGITFIEKIRGGNINWDDTVEYYNNNDNYATTTTTTTTTEEELVHDNNNLYSHDESLLLNQNQYEEDQNQQETYFVPPAISINDIAVALRWTAKINQRLHVATTRKVKSPLEKQSVSQTYNGQQQHIFPSGIDHLRGGGSATTQVYRIPERQSNNYSRQNNEDTTTESIFYTKSIRDMKQYGPDLEKYLEKLVDMFSLDHNESPDNAQQQQQQRQLELTLALFYMDRACSVTTPRNNDVSVGVPPLPYCSPRTVHRLILTSFLVAISAVRDVQHDMTEYYYAVQKHLNIPIEECEIMINWMKVALGDYGISITPNELYEWKTLLESRFG